MSAPALAFSDQAYRANTVPGAANSTTGAGSNFTDVHGGIISITNDRFAITDDNVNGANDTNTFNRDSVVIAPALNSLDQKLVFYFDVSVPSGVPFLGFVWSYQLGYSSPGNGELFQVVCSSSYVGQAVIYNQTSGTPTNRAYTSTFGLVAGHKYSGTLTLAPPTGGSRLATLVVTDLTAGSTQSCSFAETASGIQSATGFAIVASTYGGHTTYHDRIDIFSNPSAVYGTIAQTANSPSGITLVVTPSGGTGGGYTYQWYKSTTAGFTPGSGNAISGATSATLNSSAPSATTYYVCVVTDSAANSNPTAQWTATPYLAPLAIAFAGTSITIYTPPDGTYTPAQAAANAIIGLTGPRTITVVDQGVAGSASAQWVSGSTNTNALIAAAEAAVATYVHWEMGANDAGQGVSASAFGTNMASAFSATAGAGLINIISYPTGLQPGCIPFNNPGAQYPSNALTTLASYLPVIDSLINGTTVRRGATATFPLFAARPDLQLDGLHPNGLGADVLGSLWARPMALAMNLLPIYTLLGAA